MEKVYNVLVMGSWEVPIKANSATDAETTARHLLISQTTGPFMGPGTFHVQAVAGPNFESPIAAE